MPLRANRTAGTVRDLLQHTSGNYDRGGPNELFGDPSRVWSASDITEAWLTTSPREPGSGFTYASSNYLLLGLLIEEVTGDSYAAAVRERVIEPAGLLDTYVAHFESGPMPFDPFIQRGQDIENYTSIATFMKWAGIGPKRKNSGTRPPYETSRPPSPASSQRNESGR